MAKPSGTYITHLNNLKLELYNREACKKTKPSKTRKGLIRSSNSPAMINPIPINSRRTAVKKRIRIYKIIATSFYVQLPMMPAVAIALLTSQKPRPTGVTTVTALSV